MTSHAAIIPGRPTTKGRPRFNPRTGKAYTPKETIDAEKKVAAAWDGPTFDGPVGVEIHVTKDRTLVTVYKADEHHNRPQGDIDNYLKLVLDGLNGIAFNDDSQVVWVAATKGECG